MPLVLDRVPVRILAEEIPFSSGQSDRKHAAIILLHGAGGNLDFWVSRFGPLLREVGIALYAPHYFDRTGTVRADPAMLREGTHIPDWLSVVDATVNLAASRPGIDAQRIVLAGISLGGFLSLAYAAQLSASHDPAQRRKLRAVVEISGGLVEPYTSQATAHFPPTLILHGEQDAVVPSSCAHHIDRRLTQLDVAHRTEILPHEGHWFTTGAQPRILQALSSFLEEHLSPTPLATRAM